MTDTPRLRIAALLPHTLQVRLLTAVEHLPSTIVCFLTAPHDLARLPDSVSLIVVDPMSGGSVLVASVRQLLHHQPVWPLLVYTAVTPASLCMIAALGRQGLREVVLTPYEDFPERFARTLWRIATAAPDAWR